ncbi:glycoside hydrolase family 3 protein [Marinicellulosiphila megalodicopiae]|uniref:glycoside hydrolase family 3 protein n=1 Tax=Marinicellulosiphila megalodicopiae TaxID=2724896 RepID=UPI003BB04AF5
MSQVAQKIGVLIVGVFAIGYILFSSSQTNDTIEKTFWAEPKGEPGVDYRYFSQWPEMQPAYKQDDTLEKRIQTILGKMTLEEKIGQMIQIDVKTESTEEVNQYHIGNLTIGIGEQPGRGSKAQLTDWLALLDEYWVATQLTAKGLEYYYQTGEVDMQFKKENPIPPLWFIDAIHGSSNVYGSVIFPHNINLGMANDAKLVEKIGQATAKQVLASGHNVAMVSSATVVRDDRWGRVYEGFSEHPEISMELTSAMIKGLNQTTEQNTAIAGVKHFLAAGDTDGIDRGNALLSQDHLITLHAQSYMAAIKNGAQVIGVGLNSINGKKNHGSKFLIQNILKEKFKFDGIVTTDWQGASYVLGCWEGRCGQAINAGIDVFLIPMVASIGKIDREDYYKLFIENTIKQVENGSIKMTRIDDAVTRILRVKIRSGLFDAPMPSLRAFSGNEQFLDNQAFRLIAREAVAKSLVLLKNDQNILPLNQQAKILLVGDSVRDIKSATGGYSMGFKDAGGNSKYPAGITLEKQFKKVVGNITYKNSKLLSKMDIEKYSEFDVIFLVLKEPIYAGISGDVATLDFAKLYPDEYNLFETLAKTDKPLVVMYLGGRPLYMNNILNQSDAVVAAWFPGTEVSGITDVLFRNELGAINQDFFGKLSFSWPATPCQFENNIGQKNYAPLFAYGYGLTYESPKTWQDLPESSVECQH